MKLNPKSGNHTNPYFHNSTPHGTTQKNINTYKKRSIQLFLRISGSCGGQGLKLYELLSVAFSNQKQNQIRLSVSKLVSWSHSSNLLLDQYCESSVTLKFEKCNTAKQPRNWVSLFWWVALINWNFDAPKNVASHFCECSTPLLETGAESKLFFANSTSCWHHWESCILDIVHALVWTPDMSLGDACLVLSSTKWRSNCMKPNRWISYQGLLNLLELAMYGRSW